VVVVLEKETEGEKRGASGEAPPDLIES